MALLLDLVLFGIGGLIVITAFTTFGRHLPEVPMLNKWPIIAIIRTYQQNGVFPRTDKARLVKNKDNSWILQIKKSGIDTDPISLAKIQKGSDGLQYVEIIQTSKSKFTPVVPSYVYVKDGEEVNLSDEGYKFIVQDEKLRNWERAKYKENIAFTTPVPDSLIAKYGNYIGPFVGALALIMVMISAVGAFQDVAESLVTVENSFGRTQELNIQILDRLDRLAFALTGTVPDIPDPIPLGV